MNTQIRVPEIRLIDAQGAQVGVVKTREALAQAEAAGLDLVEISPNVRPPVCRIMNYGKYLFEQSKKRSAQKKKQRLTQVKEVKFRPATDVGDYHVKLRKIKGFLERGDKVKVSLRFRGREMQHRELGIALLERLKQDLSSIVVVEQEPKFEGRQVAMVVAPSKIDTSKNDKPKAEAKKTKKVSATE